MTVPAWVKAGAASLGLGGIIGIVLAFTVLGGECSAWRQDHPKPAPPVAQVLPPTPAELATPSAVLPCVPVKVLQPTEKRRKEIATETGRPAPAPNAPGVAVPPRFGEIVLPGGSSGGDIVLPSGSGEPDYPLLLVDGRPYPESPAGGKLWIHLEQDGSTTVVAKPNDPEPEPEEKFWSFRPEWELGGLYGIGQAGDARSRAWAALEPVRAGRLHLRVEAGVDLRAGQSDGYAMAGAVWRSN